MWLLAKQTILHQYSLSSVEETMLHELLSAYGKLSDKQRQCVAWDSSRFMKYFWSKVCMLVSSTIVMVMVGSKVLEVCPLAMQRWETEKNISQATKKKAGVLFKSLLDECKFTRKVAVRIKYARRCASDRSSDMSPGNSSMGMRIKWATVKVSLWIQCLMRSNYL